MSDHPPLTASRPMRTVFRLASLFTFLAVVMGSVVCATESSAACPNWPGCYVGSIVPQFQLNPMIEAVHRAVAILATPLVLVSALMALRLPKRYRLVRRLPWVSLVGCLAAGFFGMLIILAHLPLWAGILDLLASLIAMLSITAATALLEDRVERPSWNQAAGAAWTAVGALLAMHALGLIVAGQLSYTRCMSWPMWSLVAVDRFSALQVVRVVLALIAIALVVRSVVTAWPRLRTLAAVTLGLLVLEIALGLVILTMDLRHLDLITSIYSIVAVALLWFLGLFAARAGTTTPEPALPHAPVPAEAAPGR